MVTRPSMCKDTPMITRWHMAEGSGVTPAWLATVSVVTQIPSHRHSISHDIKYIPADHQTKSDIYVWWWPVLAGTRSPFVFKKRFNRIVQRGWKSKKTPRRDWPASWSESRVSPGLGFANEIIVCVFHGHFLQDMVTNYNLDVHNEQGLLKKW